MSQDAAERLSVGRLLPWLVFALLVGAGLAAYARHPDAVAPLLQVEGDQ